MGKNNSVAHINEAMNEDIANPTNPPAIKEANKLLEVKRNQIFLDDESYIANPYALLGKVIEIKMMEGECPENFNDPKVTPEFSMFSIPGRKVDEDSKIKDPVKTKSFIVDKKLSLEVGALNYLTANLDAESAYSVIVFNQATGLVDTHDDSWYEGVQRWKIDNSELLNDENICYLLVITGVVQKTIIKKKYKKFEVKAKGGAYGINIGGQLYTSAEDYSLDTRFGLSLSVLRRPIKAMERSMKKLQLADYPNEYEMSLFRTINMIHER